MKENTRKLIYATITSQVISSNGRFLYASSNFGDIAVYNIEKITSCIENISNEDVSAPISIFKCPDQPISLAYHRDFLIVGSNASVSGFEVNAAGIIQSVSWKIQLPLSPEQFEISEVNDLWVDAESEIIYAACANDIFQISLEDGKVVQKFEGHKDYIHTVQGCDQRLVTSSEDGTVKLWDNRQKKATQSIEPSKNANLLRKKLGKWIGAAAISKDWIACGGGTALALFNMNQINVRHPFHIFDEFSWPIHVTEFVDADNLLVCGESQCVMQFSLKGNMISEIETSGPAIYSAVWARKPQYKFLSVAGASNRIDVSTNFTYKDTTLNFYTREKN